MSSRSIGLPTVLHEYIVAASVVETEVQARLRRETAERSNGEMQIAPEQGQFFRFLVRSLGIKRALEVGTFTGYSALAFALELPDDGHIDCCDLSAEFTGVAVQFWTDAKVADKATLYIGPGLDTLDRFLAQGRAGSYDFAFIDADKAGYPDYFERCLKLVRPGGVFCFDNTLWDGKVADPTMDGEDVVAIRKVNAMAQECEQVLSCLVPIGDGLTLCWKRY